jgi:tetratricopeptide (TPR) repeat protein
MSDDWYAGRFPIPGGSAPEYARPLSASESLGVIEYDVGNERRRELRLEQALLAYTRAVKLFPQLAEAHASLGATLQLLGRLDDAARSYRAAQAQNPGLPGVERNLALLEEQAQGHLR